LMERFAWAIIVTTTCGILYMGARSCTGRWFRIFDGCFYRFFSAFHDMLYFSIGVNALILLLESRRRLPADSSRLFYCLVSLLCAIMWNGHASMKHDPAAIRLHQYVAGLSLAHSVVTLYSVVHPRNVLAYLAVWVMFVIQGVWLITIGSTNSKVMQASMVDTLLSFEVVVVTTAIILIIVRFGGTSLLDQGQIEAEEGEFLSSNSTMNATVNSDDDPGPASVCLRDKDYAQISNQDDDEYQQEIGLA